MTKKRKNNLSFVIESEEMISLELCWMKYVQLMFHNKPDLLQNWIISSCNTNVDRELSGFTIESLLYFTFDIFMSQQQKKYS